MTTSTKPPKQQLPVRAAPAGNGSGPLRCPIPGCGAIRSSHSPHKPFSVNSLRRHLVKFHTPAEYRPLLPTLREGARELTKLRYWPTNKCPTCEKTYTTALGLLTHRKQRHDYKFSKDEYQKAIVAAKMQKGTYKRSKEPGYVPPHLKNGHEPPPLTAPTDILYDQMMRLPDGTVLLMRPGRRNEPRFFRGYEVDLVGKGAGNGT